MKNWKNWILVLLFLFLVGSFYIIYEKYPKEIVRIEIRENERKIDSLTLVIKEKSSVIDSLKKQKERVIEKVIVKVKNLKTLTPDSTIQTFYESLQAYGEIESMKPVLKEDSSIICSLDNLRGANIIAAKYEGKLEEIDILKNMMRVSSEIITNKDSIIYQNSIILAKTNEAYNDKLENLNNQIRKENKQKKIAIYGGSVLVGILGGLLIFGK